MILRDPFSVALINQFSRGNYIIRFYIHCFFLKYTNITMELMEFHPPFAISEQYLPMVDLSETLFFWLPVV